MTECTKFMKIYIFLILLITFNTFALAGNTTSANEEDIIIETNLLSISSNPTSLTFSHGGGDREISITSNVSWTYEKSGQFFSINPLLDMNKLIVSCGTNNSEAINSGSITITGGGETLTIPVTQNYFKLSTSSLSFNHAGGTKTVNVSSNVSNWSIDQSSIPSWIEEATKSGNTITVKCNANTSNNSNSGAIKVVEGGSSKYITVTQEGSPSIITDSTSLTFGHGGGDRVIKITTNSSWSYSYTPVGSDQFFSINAVLDMNKLIVSCGTNNSGIANSGSIIITGNGTTLTIPVSQNYFQLSPASLSFNHIGGIKAVAVSSNITGWSVDIASLPSWINEASKSGSQITIKCTENNTGAVRLGSIKVYENGAYKSIAISQNYLSASPDPLTIGYKGSRATITISSNNSWTMEGYHPDGNGAEEVFFTPSVADIGSKIYVDYGTNTTTENKTGTITISEGGANKVIQLIQAPRPTEIEDITPNSGEEYAPVNATINFYIPSNEHNYEVYLNNEKVKNANGSGNISHTFYGLAKGLHNFEVKWNDQSASITNYNVRRGPEITGFEPESGYASDPADIKMYYYTPEGIYNIYIDGNEVELDELLGNSGDHTISFNDLTEGEHTFILKMYTGKTVTMKYYVNPANTSPITNFTAAATVNEQLELSWDKQSGEETYEITYSENQDLSNSKSFETQNDNSYTLTNLKNGTHYFIKIYVKTSTIPGPSSTAEATTLAQDVSNFQIHSFTSKNITVKWTNIKGADSYSLELAKNGDFANPEKQSTVSIPLANRDNPTGTETLYEPFGELDKGVSYSIRIKANYPTLSSNWQTLPIDIPSVDPVSSFYVHIDPTEDITSTAKLSWRHPGSPDKYLVEYSNDNFNTKNEIIFETQNNENLQEITELKNGTTYQFRIKAMEEISETAQYNYSEEKSHEPVVTNKVAPLGIEVKITEDDNFIINWKKDLNAEKYNFLISKKADFSVIDLNLTPETNSISLPPQPYPQIYYIKAKTIYSTDIESEFRIAEPFALKPHAPENFNAEPSTEFYNAVKLTWDVKQYSFIGKEVYPIAFSINRYLAGSEDKQKTIYLENTTLVPQTITYTDKNLVPRTEYCYEISAIFNKNEFNEEYFKIAGPASELSEKQCITAGLLVKINEIKPRKGQMTNSEIFLDYSFGSVPSTITVKHKSIEGTEWTIIDSYHFTPEENAAKITQKQIFFSINTVGTYIIRIEQLEDVTGSEAFVEKETYTIVNQVPVPQNVTVQAISSTKAKILFDELAATDSFQVFIGKEITDVFGLHTPNVERLKDGDSDKPEGKEVLIVSKLEPDTRYYTQIKAVIGEHFSRPAPDNPMVFTTKARPIIGLIMSPTVEEDKYAPLNDAKATLTWPKDDAKITLLFKSNRDKEWTTKLSTNVTKNQNGVREESIDLLTPGRYTIRFEFVNTKGDSNAFNVKNYIVQNPYKAEILDFSQNAYKKGDLITFSGKSYYKGQENTFDMVNSWRSSIDGQLRTAKTFSLNTLSVGTHKIYFKVRYEDMDWSEEVVKTLFIFPANADGADNNFISTTTILAPGFTENLIPKVGEFDGTAVYDRRIQQNVTYFNNNGKPIQKIGMRASANQTDIVEHIEYDQYGLSTNSYLPYTANDGSGYLKSSGNAKKLVKDFYDSPNADYTTNSHPVAETELEQSPLLRPLKVGAAADGWELTKTGGKFTMYSYSFNSSNEVIKFEVTSDNALKGKGYYSVGALYKTVVRDENGEQTIIYKDKSENEVLKLSYVDEGTYVRTYYVYDKFGNLRFIIPPELSKSLSSNTTLGEFDLRRTSWITEYRYDDQHRQIGKKLPEEDWVESVYDKLGRVILQQDGKFKEDGSWLFTKYDRLGRVIYTGIYVPNTNETRASLQNSADISNSLYEVKNNSTLGYTTNKSFPTKIESKNIWTLTIYDEAQEGFIPNEFSKYSIENQEEYSDYYISAHTPSNRVFGKPVKTYVRIFGNETNLKRYENGIFTGNLQLSKTAPQFPDKLYYLGEQISLRDGFRTNTGQTSYYGKNSVTPVDITSSGAAIVTTNYYDKYGRVIQSVTTDHLLGVTRTSTLYDFSGKVLRTKTVKDLTYAGKDIVVENMFKYDHTGRLLNTYQKINDEFEYTLVESNSYNKLGQLAIQDLYIKYDDPAVQTSTYTYHQRGWLESVNNPFNLGDNLFAYKLLYNNVQHIGNTPMYNGNISGMVWRSNTSNAEAYRYHYDELYRLAGADYSQYNGSSFNTSTLANKVDNIFYDLNGNFKKIRRRHNAGGIIDDLTYSYDPSKPNQLAKVTDAASSNVPGIDFSDGNKNGNDYVYDGNGNMVEDKNKGITITYNKLNLPKLVKWSDDHYIEWVYAADGSKLSKTYVAPGKSAITTHYSGGFVYTSVNGSWAELDYFNFSHGRVVKNSDGSLHYEYHLKDHLGNTRVAFNAETKEVVQDNFYYPFGLTVNRLANLSDNKYLYNGKEYEKDNNLNWYHYGARYYDPQISRWFNIDPADEFATPYAYVGNMPTMLVDPDGRQVRTGAAELQWRSREDWEAEFTPGTNQKLIEAGLIGIAVPAIALAALESLPFLALHADNIKNLWTTNGNRLVNKLGANAPDGFLLNKSWEATMKFNLPIQRFGQMHLFKSSHWSPNMGRFSQTFFNSRLFGRFGAAIKSDWNSLNNITNGILTKGTKIQWGFAAPQMDGTRLLPGLWPQFMIKSSEVIQQTTKITQ